MDYLEAFLALYFRPTDAHCIHIDRKANQKTVEAITNLLECYRQKFFPNDLDRAKNQLFIHDYPEFVIWGDSSVLKASFTQNHI